MIENFLPEQIATAIESILTSMLLLLLLLLCLCIVFAYCEIYRIDLHETSWSPTKASEDYTNNNIAHVFMGSKNYPYAKQIQKLFHQLDPQQEFTFQAGRSGYIYIVVYLFVVSIAFFLLVSSNRYTKGHFIDPHDDNAIKVLDQIPHRRTMAVVYYVTRNWTQKDGMSGKQW
jgi:hypothetical protein